MYAKSTHPEFIFHTHIGLKIARLVWKLLLNLKMIISLYNLELLTRSDESPIPFLQLVRICSRKSKMGHDHDQLMKSKD